MRRSDHHGKDRWSRPPQRLELREAEGAVGEGAVLAVG